MIDRRTFIGSIAGVFLVAARAAESQQAGRTYRIGYLSTPTRESVERGVEAFLRKLAELGWVDGRNVVIEYAGPRATSSGCPSSPPTSSHGRWM